MVILPLLGHHQEVAPVGTEDFLCLRVDAISHQDIQEMLPVQVVIDLSYVE